MDLLLKHKEALIAIVIKAEASPLPEIYAYLRKHEPEITDQQLLECVAELAKTGITEA